MASCAGNLIPRTGGVTLVAITEDGEMKNPLFRAIARLRGLDATIKIQLADLAHKFGEAPDIR